MTSLSRKSPDLNGTLLMRERLRNRRIGMKGLAYKLGEEFMFPTSYVRMMPRSTILVVPP